MRASKSVDDVEAANLLPKASPESASESNTRDSVQSPLGALLSMAVQLSVNQMVRRVLLVTDTAFLGHLGTKELAGAALANLWINVPFNFVQYAIPAITILGSHAYGAGHHKEIGVWLQTSIVFALAACLPVGLVHLFVGDLVGLSMRDDETIAFGQLYGDVLATGLIPRYLYACLTAYFATINVVQSATSTSIVAMALNVVLNQVFIYGIQGTWAGVGFLGSPLATVVSSCIQLLLFVVYTMGWRRYHLPYWGGWTRVAVDREHWKKFLALALPLGASSAVDWASLTVAGMVLGTLDPAYSAANAVLFGLFGVVYACVSGFSAATQIFMARSIGVGSMPEAKAFLLLGIYLMAVMVTLLLSVLVAVHTAVFRLWTSDHAVLDLCQGALLPFAICISLIFFRFLLSSSANAVELSRYALLVNNAGAWLLFIPLTYLCVVEWHYALRGYWAANAVGEFVKIGLLVSRLAKLDWTVQTRTVVPASQIEVVR
ncbi:hypothetical protein SPRG_10471 [Saprolegnia parasitica CBS 223.65]|uniref:MATE efflux family protein n=1 Tax=Saprolegnia parasitica (strain CBS 223.65) TaxID=695850 RepID=A0A067C0S4_SAPPC|nr:hypothetical protein SPRG_10471 [Saprolegnia parasitica CBS 223.65]KDO24394.1 hypothetical protein SPRG_10471 [Saprolegnia parasitica CBS 223.65]|eukprot:XP_012204986.1 hypothetical protein SPRG_10471 [Saprolegnia parasitica CBS 223.65]